MPSLSSSRGHEHPVWIDSKNWGQRILLRWGCTSGFALKPPGRSVGVVFHGSSYQCLQPCWLCLRTCTVTWNQNKNLQSQPKFIAWSHELRIMGQVEERIEDLIEITPSSLYHGVEGGMCRLVMTSLRPHCQAPKQISLCPHIFTPTWKISPGAWAWLSCKSLQLHGFYSSLGTKCWINTYCFYIVSHPLSP